MATLVLVDGPNFYNDVDRCLLADAARESVRHDYYLKWFDIDRLVEATTSAQAVGNFRSDGLGIVVFHSDKAIGRGAAKLSGIELDQFWSRQSSADSTSTVLVTVPGYQPEKSVRCPSCEKDVVVEARSEKGVDTSMVTYLYESVERWERAVLFTNDADFVPPILALRRRGKRVFVAAADATASAALKRASQTFFPLRPSVVATDFAMYEMLRPGGGFDRVLAFCKTQYRPGAGIAFSTHNTNCPTIVISEIDRNHENAIGEALGEPKCITWIGAQANREGRIFYGSELRLGDALMRHRHLFADAAWPEYWRE